MFFKKTKRAGEYKEIGGLKCLVEEDCPENEEYEEYNLPGWGKIVLI